MIQPDSGNISYRISPAFTIITFFAAAILVTAALFSPAHGGTADSIAPVVVGPPYPIQIGPYCELLVDPENKWTIHQAASSEFNERFQLDGAVIPNFAPWKGAVWVRFRLKNPDSEQKELLLSFNYPITDRVTLFLPRSNGGFNRLESGDIVADSPEVIPHRFFVFPLTLASGADETFYLRVETTTSVSIHLSLWAKERFISKDRKDQLLYGLLFGAALLFVVYFMAVAVIMRNASCFWFSLYVIFIGLLLAVRKGFIQEFLGPQWAGINGLIDIVDIGLLYFVGARLLRTFLEVAKYSPRIDRILMILQYLGLLFIPLALLQSPLTPLLCLVLMGLGPLFSSTVSVIFWFKGVPNAKYFALGWLIGHLTSTIDFLRISGLIPYLPFMDFILPLSLFFMLFFFALAIIDQTHLIQYFARQDPLTGLANRRHFDQCLETEYLRNMRFDRPISIVMIDVDFFKSYNDRYGHSAGDKCLRAIAEVLTEFSRRPGDLAARYGGEEFVVMFSETKAEEAEQLAECIRVAVEGLSLKHKKSKAGDVVTVSLGVAAAVPDPDTPRSALIQQADKALYQAKKAGRNRVVAA